MSIRKKLEFTYIGAADLTRAESRAGRRLDAAGGAAALGSLDELTQGVALKDGAVGAGSAVLVAACEDTGGAGLGRDGEQADGGEDLAEIHFFGVLFGS